MANIEYILALSLEEVASRFMAECAPAAINRIEQELVGRKLAELKAAVPDPVVLDPDLQMQLDRHAIQTAQALAGVEADRLRFQYGITPKTPEIRDFVANQPKH